MALTPALRATAPRGCPPVCRRGDRVWIALSWARPLLPRKGEGWPQAGMRAVLVFSQRSTNLVDITFQSGDPLAGTSDAVVLPVFAGEGGALDAPPSVKAVDDALGGALLQLAAEARFGSA